jgi:hypothetical protein
VDAGGDHRRAVAERGEVVLASTYTIALSLLLFVMLANVIVAMYGRGVVRAALDEGVRTGSRAPYGAAQCQQRVSEVLAQLLGGAMGDGVTFACEETAGEIVAAATVTFDGWLPLVPDLAFDVGASAVKERAP